MASLNRPVPPNADPIEVKVRVPAKVNLALCVGGLDEDGFHPLGTVFHAVSLFDDLRAHPAEPGVIRLTNTGLDAEIVPTDETNLAVRAAKLLIDEYGEQPCGVELKITKRIPIAGGMAGGSADGAAALLACSALWDLDIQPDEMGELASQLGSDVPFSLLGNTAIGVGRGNELTPVLTRGSYRWVLALAYGGLSTPAVYRKFDELAEVTGTAVPNGMLSALAAGDQQGLARTLRNDLQSAALQLRPELGETLQAGISAGALAGIVSGSGPTCAFLVDSEASSLQVATKLAKLPMVRDVLRVTGPVAGARFSI